MKDQIVLVVDDDPQILKLLRTNLNGAGIKTTSATSGEKAFVALQNEVYNCIISDIYMPGGNGLKLLSDVQTNYSYIPVIIISGKHVGGANATKANAKGAFYYLPKPFTLPDLEENLNLAFQWNIIGAIDAIARQYLNMCNLNSERNPDKLSAVKKVLKRFVRETRSVRGLNDFLSNHEETKACELYRYLEERFHKEAHFQF